MQVIANNITTRNPRVARIFRQKISGETFEQIPNSVLQELACCCVNSGADVLEINLQQRYDRPEAMEFAINTVQQATDRQLCLSANNRETLEAGLRLCKRPPVINFVTIDTDKLKDILPLAAKNSAEVILLISDPVQPADARQMLEKAAILVGAANEAGIPDERILLDPGLFHVTHEQGQHHLTDIMELLQAIPETFSPGIRTTCWLSNSSAGAPERLRWVIESSLLAMLSGAGLSSIFMNVLNRRNMRTVRLMKIFKNEAVYADGEIEL